MSDPAILENPSRPPRWRRTAATAIQVENVRKRYGAVEVLKGVDLTVAVGQFTAIMGKSGSGKSTLSASLPASRSRTKAKSSSWGRSSPA